VAESERKEVMDHLVEVRNLKKYFPIRRGIILKRTTGVVQAVAGIDFKIRERETFSIVGESGCGKTTTGLLVARLLKPTDGEILFRGADISKKSNREMKRFRRETQMIFQDPFESLDPKMRIRDIIREPLEIHGIGSGRERQDRVLHLLDVVGLNPKLSRRFPHEFSGGQRQRISIARALSLEPKMVICDEPVSALDVSIQAQIINLLMRLQREFQLTYIFISHDLRVVKHISDRVSVMYLGLIVESAATNEIFSNPCHPYTQALFSAIPVPDPKTRRKRILLTGEIPSPINPPSGCRFHTRCSKRLECCSETIPPTREVAEGHHVMCHLFT
jgi:oligopeptide transport system ATP-binding protein